MATDYQYSGYYSCCLEYYLHRTKSTVVLNTTYTPSVWSAVKSSDPRTCSEKRAIKPRPTIQDGNKRRPPLLPDCMRTYTQRHHCGRSFPTKGIQHSHTTKPSEVYVYRSQQVMPPQIQKKYDDCCYRDGARVGRGSPCAVLLPLSVATLAAWPTRSAPSHALRLPLPSSRFPFSPVQKIKMLLAAFGIDLKTHIIAQGVFNPSLLPRSSMLALPPSLSSNPAC